MHDEEVGVVDIELHALKEILHRVLRRPVPANEVLARPIQRDLPASLARAPPSHLLTQTYLASN